VWNLYLIQNIHSMETYIGITNDIDRRVSDHNRGINRSTKRKDGLGQHQRDGAGEWILIYAETYRSKEDAVIRLVPHLLVWCGRTEDETIW